MNENDVDKVYKETDIISLNGALAVKGKVTTENTENGSPI